LKSERVRGPFLREAADTAASMDICAVSMVKQKIVKCFRFSHAEVWSHWNSNPTNDRLQYVPSDELLKRLRICSYIVFVCSMRSLLQAAIFVLNTINRLVLLWRDNVKIKSLVILCTVDC
jgi:hypothetical protein